MLGITPFLLPALAAALASSSSSSSRTSPWAPSEWKLKLNFGREPTGTYYMPDDEEFGASGARLVLPVEVLIESESYVDESETVFMGGTSSGKYNRISVLEDPTYVNMNGQQTVNFEDGGAWNMHSRRTGKPGDASRLRMYLDVCSSSRDDTGDDNKDDDDNNNIIAAAKAATKNDVYLEYGERLYLTANCWRVENGDLETGQRRLRPIQAAYDDAQARLDERLSHDSGDRRLDGTNVVDTVMGTIDMAGLVKDRDDKLAELREARRTLPPCSTNNDESGLLSKPGSWPGSTDKLVIGMGKISVKRSSSSSSRKRENSNNNNNGLSSLFGIVSDAVLDVNNDEFHIVGTWTATPLPLFLSEQQHQQQQQQQEEEEDGEYYYEYYDDDDDDDDDDDHDDDDDKPKEERETTTTEEEKEV